MVSRQAARAELVVDATPDEAFRTFTEEIGIWWRRGSHYWNDPERGLSIRIEPWIGGRWLEIYDLDAETGFEVGRVTAWEPGIRFGLTWTQVGWPDGMATDIEVTFEPVAGGTRVRIDQYGFEPLGAEAEVTRAGYEAGWTEILGWFSDYTSKGAAE